LGWYNYLIGLYSGNAQLAYSSLNRLRRKYPKDFILNHETAVIASESFNNPELVLEIYDQLPIEQVKASSVDVYYYFRISHQITSYIKLNKKDDLNNFMKKINPDPNMDHPWYRTAILFEAVYSNDKEKINQAYQHFINNYNNENPFYVFQAGSLNQSILTKPIHNPMRNDAISWYHQMELGSINQIFHQNYIARLEGNVTGLNTSILEGFPIGLKIHQLSNAVLTLIDANRKEEISPLIERLKDLTTNDFKTAYTWGSAYVYYTLGVIYTKLGKVEDAIFYLKMARQGGFPIILSTYQYDKDLASLVGMPAFEELIKPIWPQIKD
jgi:tetratricopeptide (TPR) repeat protein